LPVVIDIYYPTAQGINRNPLKHETKYTRACAPATDEGCRKNTFEPCLKTVEYNVDNYGHEKSAHLFNTYT